MSQKGVMDMKMKIALATATLMLLPSLGMAMGCNYDKQAMSCAVVYDADSKSCVATTT
jgi:F0F1-type ATP synthase alpha subunit